MLQLFRAVFGITKQDLIECIKAGPGGSLVSCKWRCQPKLRSRTGLLPSTEQLGAESGQEQMETGDSEQVHIDSQGF